jgi:hypothetical protein
MVSSCHVVISGFCGHRHSNLMVQSHGDGEKALQAG